MLKLGIDEAGRGPVIGPMVVAGILIEEEIEGQLRELGVKDSKLIQAKKRADLKIQIEKLARSNHVIVIHPDQIDAHQNNGIKLNEIEANAMAQIINKLNSREEKIIIAVDCPSMGIDNWSRYLKSKIDNLENLEIIIEHKADVNHISVSAASILAKEERERHMKILNKKYNDEIGSGYTSDPKTKKFVTKYARAHANNGIFRKCWSTWQVAYEKEAQQTL